MLLLLYGDAAGAPYETKSATEVAKDLERRGGLVPFAYPNPFVEWEGIKEFPPGRPTDDSDQAAALAAWLVAHRGRQLDDLYQRFRRTVFDGVSPLQAVVPAIGAGKTTKRALEPLTYDLSQARPEGNEFPSNGALMRSAPLALFFGSVARVDADLVRAVCRVTHRSEGAYEATLAYVALLCALLEGASLHEAFVRSRPFVTADLETLWDNPQATPSDPARFPGRGAARLTLAVALYALTTSSAPSEGIMRAILVGGDTDTYAAVAGGLLGAYYGYAGISQPWRAVLLGSDVMLGLADELYTIATA